MKAKIIMMAVVGAWLGVAAGALAQNAEQDVLRKYVGKWEATFTVQDGEEEMKADVVARWILDKTYVQQTSTLRSDEREAFALMALMTYDAEAGGYRRWTFTSTGTVSEETGSWDAESNTMTWMGVDMKSGNVTTVSATFKGRGEEHWSIVTEDSAGKMVSRIAGVNRRK